MPRPVPDFTGVDTGHRAVGEADVLTAGVVRTARVVPVGAGLLARAAFQGGRFCLSPSHPIPSQFLFELMGFQVEDCGYVPLYMNFIPLFICATSNFEKKNS